MLRNILAGQALALALVMPATAHLTGNTSHDAGHAASNVLLLALGAAVVLIGLRLAGRRK